MTEGTAPALSRSRPWLTAAVWVVGGLVLVPVGLAGWWYSDLGSRLTGSAANAFAVVAMPGLASLVAVILLVRSCSALLRVRHELRLSVQQPEVTFEGEQQTRMDRLVAARRQADAAGEALADAEREMKTAAWKCVSSGIAYSDAAVLARVDTDTLRGWVAEVSDAWGSPAEM